MLLFFWFRLDPSDRFDHALLVASRSMWSISFGGLSPVMITHATRWARYCFPSIPSFILRYPFPFTWTVPTISPEYLLFHLFQDPSVLNHLRSLFLYLNSPFLGL